MEIILNTLYFIGFIFSSERGGKMTLDIGHCNLARGPVVGPTGHCSLESVPLLPLKASPLDWVRPIMFWQLLPKNIILFCNYNNRNSLHIVAGTKCYKRLIGQLYTTLQSHIPLLSILNHISLPMKFYELGRMTLTL